MLPAAAVASLPLTRQSGSPRCPAKLLGRADRSGLAGMAAARSLHHFDPAAVERASSSYALPSGFVPSYGTAGFRADASLLQSTVFRCGLLIGLRAASSGKACGVMITASHNPAADNGVKLVDPSGEMLDPAWEIYANSLAQAPTDRQVASILASLADKHPPGEHAGKVLIGRDTRASGPALVAACRAGVEAAGSRVIDIGVVTTPELHFSVQTSNKYGTHEELAYFTTLVESFRTLSLGTPVPAEPLHVDCANGVGALKLQEIAPALASLGLHLQLYNTGGGELNHLCGADYVQKEQTFPAGMQDVPEGARCCSIDGDADRVVFFTKAPTSNGAAASNGSSSGSGSSSGFVLLDGDRIAVLAAVYLQKLLSHAPKEAQQGAKMGVVQTAYANGASTAFIRNSLGLRVACTPTGVKYLHHEAKHFNIGIYFEANGHGTVLFDPKWLQQLQQLDENLSVMQVLAVSRLMNQTVGDAIGSMLLVEVVLRSHGMSWQQWEGLYHDLPSKQLKLKVADRGAITTADAERVCVTPEGLQDAIEAAAAEAPQGRAFARPSGTEDAVRVYAEAESREAADQLAKEVAQLVYDRAGGVGPRP